MTPDNRQPRKRRRRRRRPGAAGQNPPGDGAMQGQGQPNGNVAYPPDQQFPGGGRRRRRSRRRKHPGGGMGGPDVSTPLPVDIPAGELVPSSGVLWVKPNGGG